MIVKYPTGLYNNVIPKLPDDGGNVTYLISNNSPPRVDLLFPKVPAGVLYKRKPTRTIDIISRRNSQDILIYSVSSSSKSVVGNNSRTYQIGQVLEFNDGVPKEVNEMLVPNVNENRHDLSSYDYESMGIDADGRELIANQSLSIQYNLINKLNALKMRRANAEENIKTSQKLINDISSNIAAIEVMAQNSDTDFTDIIAKMKNKKSETILIRDNAIDSANSAATEALQIQDQINNLSVVMK